VAEDYTPREYANIATSFLLDTQRCALWAKPGMGKTAIVYTVLDILKLASSRFFPALVIAPKKVCNITWPAEQKKWKQFRDIRVVNIAGNVDTRRMALQTSADVYLINFDNIPWLVKQFGDRWPFKIVIVDEATKLKNFRLKQGGVRAAALAQIARSVGRFIELTGTPAPNGLKDLWGQMWFLDFGHRLGASYDAFLKRWFIKEAYTFNIIPRANAEAEIYKALADCTLALRPEDWFDLREPIHSVRNIDLPPDAAKLYKQLEREMFAELENEAGKHEITAPIALALTTKLLQVAGGAVLDTEREWHEVHDAKLDELEELIDELNGENVLVVYNYVHEWERIKARFPKSRKFSCEADEADWNAGKIPIMAIQPQSGGHGISLQHGGRTIIFYTNTWNLELRLQVIERLGPTRQAQSGYDRSVLVYDIVANSTVDVEILTSLTEKLTVQEALMLARARRGNSALALITTPNEFADLLGAIA